MIDKFTSLGPGWKLQITITLSSLQKGTVNILHAFKQNDLSDYVASIFLLKGSTSPYICTQLVYKKASLCVSTFPIPLNRPTTIEIDHFLSKGKLYYQYKVGGRSRFSKPVEHKSPREIEDVEVYASSPIYTEPVGVELNAYRLVTTATWLDQSRSAAISVIESPGKR